MWGDRGSRHPLTVAALIGLWVAVLANWPLWRTLLALPETAGWRGGLFVVALVAMVALLNTALLALFAWRHTIKLAATLVLLAAAFGAHFMLSYGVVIDPTMMRNVLQTNARETADLLNLRMLFTVLLLAGLPLWWLWRVRLTSARWPARAGRNLAGLLLALGLAVGLGLLSFAELASTMRNHKSVRYLINPLNSFYALGMLGHQASAQPKGPPRVVGADATLAVRGKGSRPPMLMLVVGETARADHFSLNGYARPTNPRLADLNVVSFTQVSSCGTSTAASLPCMFSHLGRADFDAGAQGHENLLDVLQRAGLAVLWLDNQSGCKGLCDRVPHAEASPPLAQAQVPAGVCQSGECQDEVLLAGLETRLAQLDPARVARGVVLVLHQMGSHGPAYYKRSPADRKPFGPECTTNVLQQCEPAQLINAYDNSIAYADHVLAEAVRWLQQQAARFEPALLYVSDHGESLGENNLYLHGMPYAIAPREQTHVPMILWAPSIGQQAPYGAMSGCAAGRRHEVLSHDHLFHTVLGWMGVRTSVYRPPLDLFAGCG